MPKESKISDQSKRDTEASSNEASDPHLSHDSDIEEIEEHAEDSDYIWEDMPLSIKERSIYLLPNLFTTGALFAGFFAIFAISVEEYERSIIAILIAALLDSMDGRLARLTNTQSQFGAHYDSLSDLVSFGVAPALLVFSWQIQELGKLAWAAAFIYGAGAALRLARFNVDSQAPSKYFIGLPSPAAAIALVSLVWVCYENGWFGYYTSYLFLILLPVLGLLMISNLPYFSFKCLNWNKKVSFFVILVLLCVFASLLLQPAFSLLAISVSYAISSLLLVFVKMMRLHKFVFRKNRNTKKLH